ESVGGETYDRSLEALAPMGSLVIIGFSSIDTDYAEVIPRLHPLSLFHRSISVGGLNIDNLAFQRRADIWGRLVDHAEQHQIRPDVRHVFPFEEIRTAHDLLGSRRSIGKVVLTMDPAAHDTGPVMVGGSRDRSVVAGSR
ncbi:MAG: zinc-binding dehydrogenase, partial [Acidimicrobiales bacterium]